MKKIILIFALFLGLGISAMAQGILVRGTVTDEGGPLPSVVILIKDTTNGTVTDLYGNYNIICLPNATLVSSNLGLKTG